MNQKELAILRKIKPCKSEKEVVEEFVVKLLEVAKIVAKPFYAYPQIVGSISKDTWLSKDHDVDLFIVFRKKVSREKLEEYGLLIGTSICEDMKGIYNIKYAEHPYVRVKVKNFEIDIVPCYETGRGDKIISAVDRSPHHTKYIKEKLVGYGMDHARLFKYFCKQIDVYGADAKHNGLSGYLCELLVLNYGTFANTMKGLSKLNFAELIDLENQVTEKEAKKRFADALVVIDPVDKNRNVGSPISPQNFLRLKLEAKKYLKTGRFPKFKKPARNMLIKKLKDKRGTNFIGIKFTPPEMIPENLYPQIRKLSKRIANYLKEYDFSVVRYLEWTDETNVVYIIFEVENKLLSKLKKQEGPSIFSKEIDNFLRKYLDDEYKPYIEDNKFFVGSKRKFLNIETVLKHFLKENRKEIPERIAEKKIKLMKEEEIIEVVNKNKEFNSHLVRKYFEV
ncbi:MAG: CCA tRNA nucleotidyltransferase [Candidatus Aenigmarchaeota archaeon]|nr:CCA tRNA nucleotidyltransferase [Candidatus Aenigmarchaeota archaeon]